MQPSLCFCQHPALQTGFNGAGLCSAVVVPLYQNHIRTHTLHTLLYLHSQPNLIITLCLFPPDPVVWHRQSLPFLRTQNSSSPAKIPTPSPRRTVVLALSFHAVSPSLCSEHPKCRPIVQFFISSLTENHRESEGRVLESVKVR